jgi:hypothetical protein
VAAKLVLLEVRAEAEALVQQAALQAAAEQVVKDLLAEQAASIITAQMTLRVAEAALAQPALVDHPD